MPDSSRNAAGKLNRLIIRHRGESDGERYLLEDDLWRRAVALVPTNGVGNRHEVSHVPEAGRRLLAQSPGALAPDPVWLSRNVERGNPSEGNLPKLDEKGVRYEKGVPTSRVADLWGVERSR